MPRLFASLSLCLLAVPGWIHGEESLVVNVDHRVTQDLGGTWQAIIDPFEMGY